jgi:adenylate cyclase
MVNGEGDALIRGEGGLVREASNLKNLAIVERALEGKAGNLQTLYTDEEGTEYFGAFQRLTAADAVVFTGVESRIVFAGIDRVTRGVVVIGGAVLALSVLFMIFYSRTISRPVRVLAAAAAEVEAGNYQPALEVKSRDEVGALTESFIEMGNGLANFERFTNKAIVALARRGILGRTGEKKTVTVCFAQIRNFEELTGDMSPRAKVDFVNQLLARMLPCVTKTGGLVDKFLTQDGLVLMALWGAALNVEPRAGAVRCVRSALMMRAALGRMNRGRRGRAPLVKMGCGINTGEVIAGQMGSDKRMEYTVIGDTVNFAARIEEPNEEFDTDILITENTWNLAGRGLVTEALPGLAVKGASKDLRVFAVVGPRGVYGPETMEDVRRLWQN